MLSTVSVLTAPSKIAIVELLDTPKTPEDIASRLNITRQGVDKQLKELQSYGIVEKRWFIGYNRPKVEFYLTNLGAQLYRDLNDLLRKFRQAGKGIVTEKLRNLDSELMDGKITVKKYREEKSGIENTMKWFTDSS